MPDCLNLTAVLDLSSHNPAVNDTYAVRLPLAEVIETPDLPQKSRKTITARTKIQTDGAWAVLVENMAGAGRDTMPSEEERAALAKQILRIDAGGKPFAELQPWDPGKAAGGWFYVRLARWGELFLSPPAAGISIPVRITIIPGASAGDGT